MISEIICGSLSLEADRTRIGRRKLVPMLLGLGLTIAGPVSAQFTLNNQTIVISGVSSNWTGDYCVGRTNSSDLLRIDSGGRLTVSNGDGYIGYSEYAVSNRMQVMGAGSLWTNPGTLFIGYWGGACRLTIDTQGKVCNDSVFIGYGSADNTAVVSDTGTIWIARSLSVGGGGTGNHLSVTNGAQVLGDYGYVGLYSWSESNSVWITGSGSLWSNSMSLSVGNGGAGNRLTISAGGTVYDPVGGVFDGCSALVTGAGSKWDNTSSLRVEGTGARLDIGNGGAVSSGTGYMGFYNPSGSIFVTGHGSVWTNASDLYVGYAGGYQQLTIAAGGAVCNAGGCVGYMDTSASNAVLVTDNGSVWSNGSTLYIGQFSAGNHLVITNAGKVCSDGGVLGAGSSASDNVVTVIGSGSVWSNRGELCMGEFGGAGQSLRIENGGAVHNVQGYVGFDAASSNNTVLVTGSGSLWNNTGGLVVGAWGSGNGMAVTNGAEVRSNGGVIGTGDSSINNTVLVAGGGSVWSNRGNLVFAASANQLLILNAGTMVSGEGRIGEQDTGGSNVVRVCGTGSAWNATSLYVSHFGTNNSLMIMDGGVVNDDVGVVGYAASSGDNTVLVTGAGSAWNSRNLLQIGVDGSDNELIITNGGAAAASSNVVLGVGVSCLGNRATVTDGALTVTNGTGTGCLNVRRGTLTLNSGMVSADLLLITNGLNGAFAFNGGSLKTRGSQVDSGQTFVVGNGVAPASYTVRGGTNIFADGLLIRSNATLQGYGWITGNILVQGRVVADGSTTVSGLSGKIAGNAGGQPASLRVSGGITNNGTLIAANGAVLEVFGPVVNNGIIDIIDGTTYFHSTFINKGVVMDAAGDADADGMPNGWERAYGLDVLSTVGTNGAAGDPDGDGMNNLDEYHAGTVPTNPDSVLAITSIRVTPSGCRVEWKGGTAVLQYLECAGTLYATGSPWRVIFTNPPPTSVATNMIDTGTTNQSLYYRIKSVR